MPASLWDISEPKKIIKKFYRKERSPIQIIILRGAFIIVLLLLVALVFWRFEADHIEDKVDDDFTYFDSLYFTIITVTTVGYGDIVPITEEARMFDALIITPVRIVVWMVFIGTAYQLVIQNYWERYRMTRALKKMKGHVIIAGYGTTGTATVNELALVGYNEDNLVVIDKDENSVRMAAEAGVTGLLGDPSSEDILLKAGIKTAGVLIIATPKDDSNTLITLTAKDLNPRLKVIARVSQEENIKQLRRAGADIIISPSLTGGHLMAMAVSRRESAELMAELLTTSKGVNVVQRRVHENEVGKTPKTLTHRVVIGVVRGGKYLGPEKLDDIKLQADDEIIVIG